MRTGKGILAVLAVAATAVALAACGSSSNSTGGSTTGSSGGGNEGGTLVGAYSAFPDYMDPALSHTIEGWTATFDTYIPLLTYAHDDGKAGGKVIPGLATALPKVSDGGKTYTLTLRKGLRYSNGEPVVAGDFKHALERVFNGVYGPGHTDCRDAHERRMQEGSAEELERMSTILLAIHWRLRECSRFNPIGDVVVRLRANSFFPIG